MNNRKRASTREAFIDIQAHTKCKCKCSDKFKVEACICDCHKNLELQALFEVVNSEHQRLLREDDIYLNEQISKARLSATQLNTEQRNSDKHKEYSGNAIEPEIDSINVLLKMKNEKEFCDYQHKEKTVGECGRKEKTGLDIDSKNNNDSKTLDYVAKFYSKINGHESDQQLRIESITNFTSLPKTTYIEVFFDGRKHYKCAERGCDYVGTTSCLLKRHFMKHLGIKPYKCTNEGCEKGFTRKDNRDDHMRHHCGYSSERLSPVYIQNFINFADDDNYIPGNSPSGNPKSTVLYDFKSKKNPKDDTNH